MEKPAVILYHEDDNWFVRIYENGTSFLKDDKGYGIRYKEFESLEESIAYWNEFGYVRTEKEEVK